MNSNNQRSATIKRATTETSIEVSVFLDDCSQSNIDIPVPFLAHMLQQIVRHGMVGMNITATGDTNIDDHHTVEDIGICLGQAFAQALANKVGIERYGFAYAPLDEALSRVVIDISGRPGLFYDAPFTRARIGGFDVDLLREFFTGFVNHAKVSLHIDIIKGINSHHQAESMFKAFALALRQAINIDDRKKNIIPSSKGSI